jgi:CRISPR-associated exonuclease Cas4
MFTEDELLPLSGLQHLMFCERQWALIHIEQQWQENVLTAEGRALHERVDSGVAETRAGVRITRGLALRSLRLGLTGRADVVEFPQDGAAPAPVEYKRGKPKRDDCDKVQVCAQALCLEEELGVQIPSGALYYGEIARRMPVEFGSALRARVESLCARMHELFKQGETPEAEYAPKCRSCSLHAVCEPKTVSSGKRASAAFRGRLAAALSEEAQEGQ